MTCSVSRPGSVVGKAAYCARSALACASPGRTADQGGGPWFPDAQTRVRYRRLSNLIVHHGTDDPLDMTLGNSLNPASLLIYAAARKGGRVGQADACCDAAGQRSDADAGGRMFGRRERGGTGRAGKPDLNVAVVSALDSAGFFVALYGGLFSAAGLHVNFTPATSSDTVISAQVKGQYDITGGNYVSYIQAQQAGRANLDIFAEGSVMEPGTQGIYVLPGSPIKTLADLKGQTIGINAPKNILYLLAASVLAEHGLSPDDVRFRTDIPLPAMAAALKAGQIDAAVLPEPFASIAEQADGAMPLVDLDQGATTSFPVEGYVVTKEWAQEYPRTVAAFDQALEEGQQIADTNREAVEQAIEALPKPLGLSQETAAVMALDNYPFNADAVGAVNQARLQRVVDVMQQFLGFDPSFKINSMLTGG
jgi:NitT/TauT family transport system substrate-binding protein